MSLFRNKSSEKLSRARRKEFSTKFADETIAELAVSKEKGAATDVVWNPETKRLEIKRVPQTAAERYEKDSETRNY